MVFLLAEFFIQWRVVMTVSKKEIFKNLKIFFKKERKGEKGRERR